jgi:hypothetical protein
MLIIDDRPGSSPWNLLRRVQKAYDRPTCRAHENQVSRIATSQIVCAVQSSSDFAIGGIREALQWPQLP